MPFKSKAQRAFMFAKHPELAKEFESETPENAKLPEHVKKMADGGVVDDEKELERRGFGPSATAKALADIAASGAPIGADPMMIDAGLKAAPQDHPSVAAQLSRALKSGPLGLPGQALGEILGDLTNPDTSYTPIAPMSMGKVQRHMAEGGIVEPEEKDAGDIPEDIKEYIDAVHKERQEARPDEGWRIRPSEKPESIVPYKRNEDAEPSILDNVRGAPGMADGGAVPDADPNQTLQTIADLSGAAPFMPPIAEDDMDKAPKDEGPGPNEEAPAATEAPVAAPKAPAAPPPSDQDFIDRANKMLGLNPQEQAGFMKLLGQNQKSAQLGAGIAGIGDAIASGGTLGKVNPGALNKSEDIAQDATKAGIEGMQTIRGNQEKAQELADKLESRDPNSPLSKWAQKAYGGIGKKLGLDLSNASAALIGDVSGKGVDALNTEFQNQMKIMQLDLQKKTLEANTANQRAERAQAEATQRQAAQEKVAGRGLFQRAVDKFTGNPAEKALESTATGEKGPVSVNSQAEYDALPSGTHYVDSHGTEKIKK